MWIIITGNPIEGYRYVGPFTAAEAADQYVNDKLPEDLGDYWVVELDNSGEAMDYKATPSANPDNLVVEDNDAA